ncbi:MAG: DUF4384 domain-containing protein [Myxococcaceae bacterium]|nr:DUF4384 domain-containing protein [Myxococcaceae bacterium]
MRGPDCPPRIELERLAAGEDVPAIAPHVAGCAACQATVATLRSDADAFLRARPVDRFLGQLDTARARKASSRRGLVVALSGALAAAVVVALVLPGEPQPGVHFKGALASVLVKRDGVVRPLQPGEVLQAGDALRFSVTVERPGFAVVLNRDGRGKVTVVAPFEATGPQAIGEGTTVLEDSAVLDATVGRETFVTVFSPRPFEVPPLVRELAASSPVQCGGCVVETASFDKR